MIRLKTLICHNDTMKISSHRNMKHLTLTVLVGVLLFGCESGIPSRDLNQNGKIDIYEDNSLPVDQRVQDALSRMTLEEKAALVVGKGFSFGAPVGVTKDKVPGAAGNTHPIESLGLPSMVLADGPAGLRISPTREGDENTYYCTAFPIETLLSSSWDTELVKRVGVAMGNEVKEYGVDILLAPALNIHRNPRAGRNFEYYSEDPLLAGKMTAAMVNGVESVGVGTSIKHFAANNQETNRMVINTVVGERALREIYLRGFEIAVREAQPWTVMSAYNQVNDQYASENHDLLTKVLRDDWGFEGLVMTDWFAGKNVAQQMYAGNDLLMPGGNQQVEAIIKAVNDGDLSEEILDLNAGRILAILFRSPVFFDYKYSDTPDLKAHADIARKAAAEGMILLKNENQTLPLQSASKTIAAFGNTSYKFIAGGSGSGDVNEAYTISLVQGLEGAGYAIDEDLRSVYETYMVEEEANQPEPENMFMLKPPVPEMKVSRALARDNAKIADIAFITIGRNSGEFADRPIEGDFYLTKTELDMIDTVSEAFHAEGKKVVVIMNIGNVVETASWRDKVDAILLAWQGGQEGGNAVADIIKGEVNPSGKLPTTFPVKYEDIASSKNFPGVELSDKQVMSSAGFPMGVESEVVYEEGIYVGYRYFQSFDVPVAYEFGYGLSYSDFEISDLKLSETKFMDDITISVKVTNTGETPGKEVVQLYLSAPDGSVNKPASELKGFTKTKVLQPGASEVVKIKLTADKLASFDSSTSAWIADAGTYTVKVGNSSSNIMETGEFDLASKLVVEKTSRALVPSRSINELKP